jgi:hypothetical protein
LASILPFTIKSNLAYHVLRMLLLHLGHICVILCWSFGFHQHEINLGVLWIVICKYDNVSVATHCLNLYWAFDIRMDQCEGPNLDLSFGLQWLKGFPKDFSHYTGFADAFRQALGI